VYSQKRRSRKVHSSALIMEKCLVSRTIKMVTGTIVQRIMGTERGIVF